MRKNWMQWLLVGLVLTCSLTWAQAPQSKPTEKADEVRIEDEDVRAGQQADVAVKNAQDVLNATLSASIQGSFDAQSALEAIGRIRVAYLALENAKLAKTVWEANLRADKNCAKCAVDLALKVLRRPPKQVVKRE